jgi:hypothetical protein
MRRPWWDKPAWNRHIAGTPGTPAAPTGVPWIERGGLSAAEQAEWAETTAWLSLEMDARFAAIHDLYLQRQPKPDHWGRRYAAVCAAICLLLAVVVTIGGHS